MDEGILLFLQDHVRVEFLTPVMKIITLLGGLGGTIWIVTAITLMIIRRTRWLGISMGATLALSGIFTNLLLKKIINRPRPYDMIQGLDFVGDRPTDASFPSGHASILAGVATVMVLALPWIIEKKKAHRIAAVFVVVALIVSFSRLYLGVHYPTDVFSGMLLGIIYGVVAVSVVGKIRKKYIRTDEDSTTTSPS